MHSILYNNSGKHSTTGHLKVKPECITLNILQDGGPEQDCKALIQINRSFRMPCYKRSHQPSPHLQSLKPGTGNTEEAW